jgi:hypothetical protein
MSENNNYETRTNLLSCQDIVAYMWAKSQKEDPSFKPQGSTTFESQVEWADVQSLEKIKKTYQISKEDLSHSSLTNKEEYSNRVRSGIIVSFGIYTICSAIVMVFVHPLLQFMAVSPDIISESASYIRIECVANTFGILYSFICVALITIGRDNIMSISPFLQSSIMALNCSLPFVEVALIPSSA